MRYLITGATGFIGAHLTRRLAAAGAAVSVWAQPGVERAALRPVIESIDLHEVDVRTFSVVAKAVDAIAPDVVFHCAAAGVTDPFLPPDEALRANVYGTIHLLRAIKGRARVIVLRTPGELDALNVYAVSKAAAWQFCRMYRRTQGWPVAGAMLFQVYGPGQSRRNVIPAAIEAAVSGRDFPITAGRQQRDWIYIDDVIDGLLAVAAADRFDADTLELGTGQTRRVQDVVERVYALAGQGGRVLVGALPDRPGEVERYCAEAETTWSQLKWRARVSLDDGLQTTIEAMKHG